MCSLLLNALASKVAAQEAASQVLAALLPGQDIEQVRL
jgi:hypothetical protein